MKKRLHLYQLLFLPEIVMLCLFFTGFLHPALAQTGLPFRDDFSRPTLGTAWKADDTWSIRSSAAYNASDWGSLVTATAYTAESYVIETAARGLSGSYWRQFRITFGQVGFSDPKTYVLSYNPDSGGQLTLGRSTDNIYYPQVLDEVSIYPALEDASWYKFRIARYKSGLIQVYLDKGQGYPAVPMLEAVDLTYKKLGRFGWMVSTQTAGKDFFVDWIDVRLPESEKPAIQEKPKSDDLITQVSTPGSRPYTVAKLRAGSRIYSDRDYQATTVPAYMQDASFIQTAMEDKSQVKDEWLTTFMKKQVIVYVAYDPRATVLPAWLQGWHKTGDVIRTNDPGTNYLEVYSKLADYWQVYPRPLILGATMASPAAGAKVNYLVAAVQLPAGKNLQAEQAQLSGAVQASNHAGYRGTGFADYINDKNDYIEWSTQVTVPGTYSISYQFANAKNERVLALDVDGVPAGSCRFSAFQNWDTWLSYSGPKVFLKAGTHKIRLTATGSSGPNIDYLSLSFISNNPMDNSLGRFSAWIEPAPTRSAEGYNGMFAYPNPFQVQTTICYELFRPEKVTLTVYTQEGKQQLILVDGMQAAGKHQVDFHANHLASGLYLYELQFGQTRQRGKLLKH